MAANPHPISAALEPEFQVTARRQTEDGEEYLTGTYPSFLRACRVAEMLEAAGWDTSIAECP